MSAPAVIDLGAAMAPARGEALGAAHAELLREASEHMLALEAGVSASARDDHEACCHRFLEALQGSNLALHDEVAGMARASGVSERMVAALNLLGDSPLGLATADEAMMGTSTLIHAGGDDGVVMAGAVNGGVLAWGVTATIHEERGRRIALLRGPGGLGWAGLNDAGLTVMAAHPRWPSVNASGEAWPVLLRQSLTCEGASIARELLRRSPRRGGRYWLLSDGAESFGIESAPDQLAVTRRGAKAAHVHTDHFFDVGLRSREREPVSPRSFRRMELSSSIYVQRQPKGPEAMFEFLAELDRTYGATGDAGPHDSDLERFGPSVQFVAQCEQRSLLIFAGCEGSREIQRLDVSP